jgi:hypothetical protein
MLRQYMHVTKEGKSGNLLYRGPRTYLMLASTLLCTTLVLLFALQLIGQAGDTPWPGPVSGVIQLVLVHVL